MAVQRFSEDSGSGMSPRISFSRDLCSEDGILPVEQQPFRSSSPASIDFDFCVHNSFHQDSSSADELFSDGKMIPSEIKRKYNIPAKKTYRSSSSASPPLPLQSNSKESNNELEKHNSKSLWPFKRSNSLNCESGYRKSLCLLPLLSRSNSTGSVDAVPKRSQKHESHKQASISYSKSSVLSSSTNYQKPPLKKNYGSHGNNIQVNHVLNVSTGNLFGMRSIFFSGRDKNRKK